MATICFQVPSSSGNIQHSHARKNFLFDRQPKDMSLSKKLIIILLIIITINAVEIAPRERHRYRIGRKFSDPNHLSGTKVDSFRSFTTIPGRVGTFS